ncbi:pseudouridine synthase [Motilimonas eburnea]|uniref:pseudouridine synthase n=1 Tax=Motilimonas eburnea TaxID=1737488 RepID=UPI001E3921B3|nr:pseudouridine synthase [Motilimonas eburnea]MCE2573110.1 pseudouridine synthase [Motilimonas eburnea]
MRLDKFLCEATSWSRAEAKKAIARGRVAHAGNTITDPGYKLSNDAKIALDGATLALQGPVYIALYKPEGYICATQDEVYPCVLHLIEQAHQQPLHPAGRLDVDTTGLVLLTSDGQWSHRVTSPKKHCHKVYHVELAEPICADAQAQCEAGILLHNETKPTRPAKLDILTPTQVRITLQEGKYHQVKRMFAALNNKVIKLHRASVGPVDLTGLNEGEWRYLTPAEVAAF